MYAIQGRPRDKSEDWLFCQGINDVPDLFFDAECAQSEFEDWQESTPEWEYRIVKVELNIVAE